MRRQLFLCFLLLSVAIQAQTNYYSIMLGAYSAAHLTHFAGARQVGYVYSIPVEGGFQVYVGGFESDTLASNALTKLQGLGYTEARMIARQIDPKSKVSVIQLASQHYLNPIKWSRFSGLQNLQVIVQDNLVRIVTGPYENGMAAQVDLANAQANGFPDAFVKLHNPIYLHQLLEFETQAIVAKPNPAKPQLMIAPPATTEVEIAQPQVSGSMIEKDEGVFDAAKYLGKGLSALGYIKYEFAADNYTVAKSNHRLLNNYVRLSQDNQMQDVAIFLMSAKDAATEPLPPDDANANVISKELLELTDALSDSEVAETLVWHNKLIERLKTGNNLLRVTYAGAWLRLQEHYIANGLSETDANNVALLVLKLSSEEYLTHLTQ